MMRKTVFFAAFAVFFAAALLPSFGSGRKDSSRDSRQVSKAAAALEGEARIIAVYIIDDSGNKFFSEGMYLPQAAAAYLPTPFSFSSKERRLSFDQNVPYRVLSKAELKSGVRLYTLETTSALGGRYSNGRVYTFSFPRSALGREGGAAQQPALYALERAIRISSAPEGSARLESLQFDETTEVFKVSVSVASQSMSK